MPKVDLDDLSHLSYEIEEGMRSPISPKTHEEIFAEIKGCKKSANKEAKEMLKQIFQTAKMIDGDPSINIEIL